MGAERPDVRVCDTCADAEDLILRLERSGCDMRALSLAGRNAPREGEVSGCYEKDGRMMFWGLMSSFWEGAWRLLLGAAYFAIPGVGIILVGGPLATAIAAALEQATGAGSLSVLGVGLRALGLPHQQAADCEMALREDKLLVIAHGAAAAADVAQDNLQSVARK